MLNGYGVSGDSVHILALVVIIGAGLLMVSNVKYSSFKGFDFKSKVHPWVYVSLRPFADGQSKDRMPDFFSRIESVILNSDQVLANIQDASRWTTLYEGFKSRLMFEPNFYGMGYRRDSSKECEVIMANVE